MALNFETLSERTYLLSLGLSLSSPLTFVKRLQATDEIESQKDRAHSSSSPPKWSEQVGKVLFGTCTGTNPSSLSPLLPYFLWNFVSIWYICLFEPLSKLICPIDKAFFLLISPPCCLRCLMRPTVSESLNDFDGLFSIDDGTRLPPASHRCLEKSKDVLLLGGIEQFSLKEYPLFIFCGSPALVFTHSDLQMRNRDVAVYSWSQNLHRGRNVWRRPRLFRKKLLEWRDDSFLDMCPWKEGVVSLSKNRNMPLNLTRQRIKTKEVA